MIETLFVSGLVQLPPVTEAERKQRITFWSIEMALIEMSKAKAGTEQEELRSYGQLRIRDANVLDQHFAPRLTLTPKNGSQSYSNSVT